MKHYVHGGHPVRKLVAKNYWSRLRADARKSLQHIKGRHDRITRELRRTPEDRIREFVLDWMLQRSFHDALFPNLHYQPEPISLKVLQGGLQKIRDE